MYSVIVMRFEMITFRSSRKCLFLCWTEKTRITGINTRILSLFFMSALACCEKYWGIACTTYCLRTTAMGEQLFTRSNNFRSFVIFA